MEKNKYDIGQTVYVQNDPKTPYIIQRYVDRIYYCQLKESPGGPDRIFFERDLFSELTVDASSSPSEIKPG